MLRVLRWLALVTGVACAAIGLVHLVWGLASVPGEIGAGATVDSRERFYNAIFIGYGLAWIWAARQSPLAVVTIRWLAGILLLGGIGRLLSLLVSGQPHWFQLVLTVVELVLPSVYLGLSRAAEPTALASTPRTEPRRSACRRRPLVPNSANVTPMTHNESSGDDVITSLSRVMTMPQTPTTEAALGVTRRYASPTLRNHALRSYLWGVSYADRYDIVFDRELFYVAALLHDLGLEGAFDNDQLPFEEAGAHVAWVFAAAAGWPEDRRDRVAHIIITHMRDDVSADQDPESHLLQVGTTMDISGHGVEHWPAHVRRVVLHEAPRGKLSSDFTECFLSQTRRKPTSAAAAEIRSGLAQRIRTNPLDQEPGSNHVANPE